MVRAGVADKRSGGGSRPGEWSVCAHLRVVGEIKVGVRLTCLKVGAALLKGESCSA